MSEKELIAEKCVCVCCKCGAESYVRVFRWITADECQSLEFCEEHWKKERQERNKSSDFWGYKYL